jgi:zinc protease
VRRGLAPALARVATLAALAALLPACPKKTPLEGPTLAPGTPGQPAPAPPPPPEPDPWQGRTDLVQAPPAQPPQPVTLPPIERFTLPNGLEVLLVEDRSLPVVSFDLAVKAGTIDEPREKRSLASFAAAMLTRGAGARNADQIAETIDRAGGTLAAEAALEWTKVSCEAMAKDAATCLALVPDVVVSPKFPEKEMRQVREELEGSVRRTRDDPAALAAEHFDNALWGDDHVRGWPITTETIAAVRPKDLQDWHKAWFRPGNALLVVSGDFDAKAMRGQVGRAFARWARGKPATHKTWPAPALQGVRVRLVDKPDQTQSQILLGHPGVSVADPDWLATQLMSYTLGEGAFSSRLMKVVRSQGGKTYSADASFETARAGGTFRARTFTRNSETAATLALVRGELARMKTGGPSADELVAAQANLQGSHPIGLQSARDVGRTVLWAELLGLGEAFVREYPPRVAAVTLEQVKAAAAENLQPDALVVVIVGRASEVSPQLVKAGLPVDTFSWLDPSSKRERDARVAQKAGPVDPARAAQGRKLLDAALAAKGGEARLRALKDLTSKGTVKIVDRGQTLEGPFVRWFVPGQALRLDITAAVGKLTVAVTGAGSWIIFGDRVQDLPKENAAQQFASLWRDRDIVLLRHLEADAVVEALPREKIDGKEYDVVVLKKAGGALETRLYLDPKTRLVFRMEYQERGSPQREEYRDYRAVQGIQFAFRQHGEGQGQAIDAVTSEIKLNTGVPPGTFDKPAK